MVFVHSVFDSLLVFSSLALPKTLSHPKPSLPFLSLKLKLNLKATSAASLFSTAPSSRLVNCVAVSSEFQQDEEDFVGGSQERERNFSPDLKLFVGNLPFNVDSSDLAALFERAGNVEMVEVIYDKLTGRSRGFEFVTMSSVQEVEAAEQQFNGYVQNGRENADGNYCSITIDGDMQNDILQQRLNQISRQREELQRMERGGQKVSRISFFIVAVVWLATVVCFFIALSSHSWLWLV